ncbi:sensor histidine kinase [uncultured Maritalea sp.]|jgi:signal transduction histidine kinase|uniref:sensor histidine kinase n=1 Tax=uncultured Maritalea sp. TaxID=757249 RepID=UPI00261D3B77|nr:sensor histidine kinase [uncultured Maritalea sp.]
MEINAQTVSKNPRNGITNAQFVGSKQPSSEDERWLLLLDAILAVAVLIATILMATGYDDQPLIDYSPLDLPMTAVLIFTFTSGTLMWRRRFPIAVLLAGLTASGLAIFLGYFEGPLIAVLVGLYGVGRLVERSDHSFLGLFFTLVFVAISAMNEQHSNGILWVFVQLLTVVLVWYVGRFVNVRAENRALVAEQEKQEQRQRTNEAQQAVANERTRIARDLHDIVAHHVSLMTVQAAAARTVAQKDLPRAIDAMEAVEQVGREALNELRQLLGILRLGNENDALDPQPGLDDVPRLVEQMRDTGLRIDLQIEGNSEKLTKGSNLAAYRIIQEALTNVLKHAGPKATSKVSVIVNESSTEITVCDDGVASANVSRVGHGLIGMAERASLLGGTFSAGKRSVGGYEVRTCLPHPQLAS